MEGVSRQREGVSSVEKREVEKWDTSGRSVNPRGWGCRDPQFLGKGASLPWPALWDSWRKWPEQQLWPPCYMQPHLGGGLPPRVIGVGSNDSSDD